MKHPFPFIAVCFMLLTTIAVGQPSTLPYHELNEIIDLYCDGQYDVVKAKLGNIGFTLTKSTPDYSLNGVTHSGDFVMIREKESAVGVYKEHGFKDIDRFFFSTTGMLSQRSGYTYDRDIDISFDYDEKGAVGVYNTYRLFWKNAIDTTYQLCSTDRYCTRFMRGEQRLLRNPTKDIGAQRAAVYNMLDLEMSDKPVEIPGFAPTPREFIHGSLRRHISYAVPTSKKAVSTKSRKRK